MAEIVQFVFEGNIKEAAAAGGVDSPTLHRIVYRTVKEPKLSTLKRLAEGYGVPLSWLTGEESALPMELGETAAVAPRWWKLLACFHDHKQHEARQWLSSVSTGDRDVRRIMQEYDNHIGLRDRARRFLWLLVGPAMREAGTISEHYRPAWRDLLSWETTAILLTETEVRRRLERI